jgi:5-deoxy-glucuronate isomerase
MAMRYKVNGFQGYQKIVTPENSDLEEINLAFIKNNADQKFTGNTNGEESVFVITEGSIKFFLESKLMGEMQRKNVFDEPPCAVYLPPYSNYSIEFVKASELSIVSCKAKGTGKPKFIEPKDIRFKRVGKDTYMSNVHEILPGDFPAEKLILGETITDPGNWAGYPPEETTFEELDFFKITPRTGFGTVRVFNELEDNMFLIKNDEVLTIPKGYHPISAAPKHRIYYLWALAGKTRRVIPFVHPDYRCNGKT